MPYDIFSTSLEPEDKPDTIKAVVKEFRDRFKRTYPSHSPDELGNFVTICKILGSYKKKGVTLPQMRASIDEFYARHLDRTKPEYPAWRKWLWVVQDTRPRDENTYTRQQEEQRSGTIKKKSRATITPDQAAWNLEVARKKLELAMEDPELYSANHGPTSIDNLKTAVSMWERRVKEL